ncbi:MAG: hypothetical protein HZB26_13495 [Candidatus Hydrogenedentes bacterium]|nr:hypothetical protein [Candidatus Hydrogenedentota bacterium]
MSALSKDFLFSAVQGLGIALLVHWLVVGANQNARYREGKYIVEYGKRFRLFVLLLGIALVAVTLSFCFRLPFSTRNEIIGAVLFFGAFFGLYLILANEVLRSRIMFDDENIYRLSAWRRVRTTPWAAITGWSESPAKFVIETQGHDLIRLPGSRYRYLSGVPQLIEVVKQKAPQRTKA